MKKIPFALLLLLSLLIATPSKAAEPAPGETKSEAAAVTEEDGQAAEDTKKDGDTKDEKKVSADGSYEWKMSWGGGFELGVFFTELNRWNTHILNPNEEKPFDLSMMIAHDLAFEVSPVEGLRLSLFGGFTTSYTANPGLDAYYIGLEPAFTVRRGIVEFAAGAGVGYGGVTLWTNNVSAGDSSILLARPFLETRLYPADFYALYARLAFNLVSVLDFKSDTLKIAENQPNRTTSADQLSESGPYLALGVRFGDYPDHIKSVPDTDGDTFRDDVDGCPAEAEDVDTFEDEDGCPDLDNDKDGVADATDACPMVAEDKDGWKDEDGCPEEDDDTDGDGILNPVDKCVDKPEDFDKFQDEDGCPDLDNDGDGILDVVDDCPLEKGVAAKKGCPYKMVELTKDKIVIKEKVFFELNKAEIKSESFNLLDEVAEVLAGNPQIKKLEVQGHTDHKGKDKANLKLSDARAKSVYDYLVGKGIDAERLSFKGYGMTQPLIPLPADGKETEEAAAQNRRVEFVILEQDEVKEIIREDQLDTK